MEVILDMSKGSLHRLWVVLAVFSKFNRPLTLKEIGEETGMPYPTIVSMIKRLNSDQIPGLRISRGEDEGYYVSKWGFLINKNAASLFYDKIWSQLDEYRISLLSQST